MPSMNNGLITKISTFYCIKSFISPKFKQGQTKITMPKRNWRLFGI